MKPDDWWRMLSAAEARDVAMEQATARERREIDSSGPRVWWMSLSLTRRRAVYNECAGV